MASPDRHVAIVGTGLIGRAWAAIFARAGWKVRLSDPHIPTLKAAPRLIRDELRALARHGLADDPDGAVARISVAGSLREAVKTSRRSLPSSTGWRRRTRCWSPRPRPSPPRGSRRRSPAGRAVWSAIPSIRRIWCRWSNSAARRGPRPMQSTVREQSIARLGRCRSPSTARSTVLC